jgi:hypothetical protein
MNLSGAVRQLYQPFTPWAKFSMTGAVDDVQQRLEHFKLELSHNVAV